MRVIAGLFLKYEIRGWLIPFMQHSHSMIEPHGSRSNAKAMSPLNHGSIVKYGEHPSPQYLLAHKP